MIQKGKMDVYDCGQVKLHAYKTNDYLENEVFILQKADNAVVIESPCFFDNRKELEQYLSDMHVAGVLLSYHMGGGTFCKIRANLQRKMPINMVILAAVPR